MNARLKVRGPPPGPQPRARAPDDDDKRGGARVAREDDAAKPAVKIVRGDRDEAQDRYGNAAVTRANGKDLAEPAQPAPDTAAAEAPAKPSEAARQKEEKERRLVEAAAQLEEPETVPDPIPLAPMTVPMVPPLAWRPVVSEFLVSPAPAFDTTSWRARDEKTNRDILDSALRAYESVKDVGRGHHDEMAAATNAAQQAIALELMGSRMRIETSYLRCDDDIARAYDRAIQTLREGAGAADRLVLENYLAACDALTSASAQMKKAIKANADTAAKQTDDIIDGLSKDFITPLEAANKECSERSQKTTAALQGWKGGIEKRFPLEGDPKTAVENEARQGAAQEGAKEALKLLGEKTTQINGRFTANIKQVGTDIRARVGPSLKAHAAKIEPEGNAAVNKAFNSAFSALKRNANEARKATAKTHAEVVAQVAELRAAERKRLERDLASALTAANDEAQAACTTLLTTSNATLPHYGEAVERLHDSLADSTKQGPQALATMAGASVQVTDTLDQSRDLQRSQIDTVHAGVGNGTAAREVRVRDDNLASVFSADASFGESSRAAASDMTFVAQEMTQGLTALSAGVIAAAQDWIRPLAKAFATFLGDVKADLDRGRPAFIERVDKAKNDFLTWLAPQSDPDSFFGADLNNAAIEARKKVETAMQETAASLDAGIIDKVDETRLGNALRPLTRLQGQLLRSMWPKTPPSDFDSGMGQAIYRSVNGTDQYTLDGHLKVALGEGSDDYNAAVNYLNGNTAEGARYELEASMHWYNDEEERIEGIMRGLTPTQLADLHGLKAYDATKRKVQRNLDGTDLNVFNALDAGNQFQADAYRMRDEINDARERGNKDATNQVLAKYSRATAYAGRPVSADERRIGVQLEFANIEGIDLNAKAAEMAKQREAEEAAKKRAAAPAAVTAPGAPAPAPAAGPTIATAATTPATAPRVPAPTPSVPPPAAPAPGAATPAPDGKKPSNVPASLADRWMTGAIAEPGAVVEPDKKKPSVTKEEAAAQAMFDYATRAITVPRMSETGDVYEATLTFEGRDRDYAHALIFYGEGSPEARAAALGVEMQRSGKPDILKVDAALVDPRLDPDLPVKDASARAEIRRRALEDRKRMLEIYARDYGGLPPSVKADPARVLINQLDQAFGNDKAGANLAAMLVRDEYPTPETASYAMEYAIEGVGTNNELIDRTLGRMNRDQIAEMRKKYDARTHGDLYADLGVFGHAKAGYAELGVFGLAGAGDLSGDDRLRAERMLLGVPRNDKERAEVAAFTMQQQREETGLVGGWLASGSLQDIMLSQKENELVQLVGGPITFGRDGEPQWSDTSKFKGNEFAGSAGDFAATVTGAQLAAENYSAKIDQYANAAAMGIAVLGAIVAAVVTVMTAGAASPLLMAAIAGITGLAAMGAQRLIKGGRYGWEEALTDLGMTAVSALTAGVGQALTLASRGGVAAVQAASKAGLSMSAARQVALKPGLLGQMGRLTGSAYLDKVLIGAGTGGLSSFGQAALQKQTWKEGHGGENLLGATFRGVLGGGVTAGVTNAIEDMPLGRLSRYVGGKANLGTAIGESTNVITRGLGKGITSSIGATAGRAAELAYEAPHAGRRMDAGDILVSAAEAGGMSLLQSAAEGSVEARAQAIFHARYGRNPTPEERPAARVLAEPQTARVLPEVETAAARLPAPEEPELARPAVVAPEVEPAAMRPAPHVPEPTEPTRVIAPEETVPAPARVAAPAEPIAPEVRRPALPPAVEEPARVRAPVVEKEGAAAAIPGSRMQLAEAAPPVQPKMLHDAVDTAVTRASTLAGSKVEAEGEQARIVTLKRADDSVVRVRVAFGDTGGTDVANFRAGKREEGVDFVVTLSSRADPDLHARAVAHELAELRFHGLEEHAAPTDLLTARAPSEKGARLSAHDAGRLAELEVLAAELTTARAAAGPESSAARGLETEIDALAAHLGLLHAEKKAEDPRYQLALSALGETSAAWQALEAAQKRASSIGLADALQPARHIDESTRLSAADRKRLAQLEEHAGRIEHAREMAEQLTGKEAKAARAKYKPRLLELEAADMMRNMGLLAPDAPSAQRARLAASVFEPDSPAARLIEFMRRTAPEVGGNDALRPGLKPDERTVPTARDLENIEKLRDALIALDFAERTGKDAVDIARLRHQAESRAASMGLVFGEAAAQGRTDFMLTRANADEALRFDAALTARLKRVRESAQESPLLRPRFGTLHDLPLLAEQIAEARAMGDHALADGLVEIAGFRLPAAAFDENPDVRAAARAEIKRVVGESGPASDLADDALVRHEERLNAQKLRADANSVRDTIGHLESQLAQARQQAIKEGESGRPLRVRKGGTIQRDIELLHDHLAALEAQAATAERVAFRPGGRTADEARAAMNDPNFPVAPYFRNDPDVVGAGNQQRLIRQVFGDAPMFQSWERFKQGYAEVNKSIRISGGLTTDRPSEWADLERVFRRWLPGRYVSQQARLGRYLTDRPIILAGGGEPFEYHEPNSTTPVVLAPDEQVRLKDRTLTVVQAEAKQRELVDDRNILEARRRASSDATEQKALQKEIHLVNARINDISEAMGEAAGLRFVADHLRGGLAHAVVDRGSGVPDIIHIDPVTGRVTVIECKGGGADLGTRDVTATLGRAARAEQTTPEYLRDLATKMMGPQRHEETQKDYEQRLRVGKAILDALDDPNLPIDVFVVRQPLQNSNRLPIQVTQYPVTRSGR